MKKRKATNSTAEMSIDHRKSNISTNGNRIPTALPEISLRVSFSSLSYVLFSFQFFSIRIVNTEVYFCIQLLKVQNFELMNYNHNLQVKLKAIISSTVLGDRFHLDSGIEINMFRSSSWLEKNYAKLLR